MSGPTAPVTRWWGWGDPDKSPELGADAISMLAEVVGPAEPGDRVSIEEVALPDAQRLPDAIADAVGPQAVLDGREHRIRRSAGQSYPDLLRLRSGLLDEAPDAVVLPEDAGQIARVLEICAAEGIAVVPFGGGTSVVGGVAPHGGEHGRVIALDLRRLRAVAIDERSLTATLGPGLRGPEAERALAERGLTLGHFPQSFEYASIGGFAATRSAGQASSGYGRFDDLVSSVGMLAPAGELRSLPTPHTAAGPALRELVVGSEGVLGVITDVTVRVRPAPPVRRYEAWVVAGFAEGQEAVRSLAQTGSLPDVIRLSDEAETMGSMGLAGVSGARKAALDAYLRLRRRSGGCIVICGWDGEREAVDRRRAIGARMLRAAGAVPLGRSPGESWLRGRFEGPYLREALLDLGYLVETLETAHTWSRLPELHRAVGSALTDALGGGGGGSLVMCHLSHAYRDGASLYFTFIAPRRPGEEMEQWRGAKAAACEAIVATQGTITHHHAIGRDHAPYMTAEVGELGVEALRALKERLDPAGIMNPGKLLPG
ncbi:MAG: FAD-binding oxidoreductase [Solirubrobacterales bacterium]